MREYIKSFFTKQHLLNNIKLKVFSLIISIVVWFVVVNITDPVNNQPYRNVRVQLVNTDVVTDSGRTIEVLNGSDIISNVTIRAPRNTIQELGTANNDSIVAIADFTKMSPDGTYVPIEITTAKYNEKIERIRSSSEVLQVKIETRKSVQLPIQATTTGEVESGYILGNVSPAQNQVKISGPESVIETIKTAKVDVQVTGFTEDITTQADIILYDVNGEPVSKKNLTMNVESVRVVAEIHATKKVPVYYATIGSPAEGYALTGEIECSPEVVTIAGPANEIANISEINVPATELNVTGQDETMMSLVNLQTFLPEKVRFADPSFNGKVSFKIYIEPLVEDSFGVDVSDISIVGSLDDFNARMVENEAYEIVLSGLAQDLEKIQLDSLDCVVNLDEFDLSTGLDTESGVYEMKLNVSLPAGVYLKEDVFVKVSLMKK